MRWREDFFPFTLPSWELDVHFEGKWMEILGCGLIHPTIIKSINKLPSDTVGWAFGLGLVSTKEHHCVCRLYCDVDEQERLAMVVYGVTDIRTFWSRDARFHNQFAGKPLDAQVGE